MNEQSSLAFPDEGGYAHEESRPNHLGALHLDPNSLYDPKYTEMKKVENLKALLNLDNQFFILNLCLGVKDRKQLRNFSKSELEKIKEDQI